MLIGLIATLFSSLFMTFMVITDKLMIGDCYDDKPLIPWIISSGAGFAFGMLLTLLTWLVMIAFLDYQIHDFYTIISTYFLPYGLLVLIAGILSIQTLYHYFFCFSVNGNSTSIAGWIAVSPIFILFLISALTYINSAGYFDMNLSLEKVETSVDFFVLAILAVLSLVAFELVTSNSTAETKYPKHILLLLLCNSLYAVLIHVSLTEILVNNTDVILTLLALLPLYWLGFTAGLTPLLKQSHRITFFSAYKKRIYLYLPAIILTEVIGMLYFFTEFFGLGTTDPTLVALIIGSHILLVYLAEVALGFLRSKLEGKNQSAFFILKMKISAVRLPELNTNYSTHLLLLSILFVTCACIYNLTVISSLI